MSASQLVAGSICEGRDWRTAAYSKRGLRRARRIGASSNFSCFESAHAGVSEDRELSSATRTCLASVERSLEPTFSNWRLSR